MKYIGIDVSTKNFNVAIVEKEKFIYEANFSYDKKGIEKLIEKINSITSAKNSYIALESTSAYHINLFSYLINSGFNVVVINPILIHNFRKAQSLRKTKNDRIDAKTIAKFIQKNPEIRNSIPNKTLSSTKIIAREREFTAKQIAATKNQIKQILFNIFNEILKFNIFTSFFLNLLTKIPSTRILKNMSIKEIQNIIDSIQSKGRKVNISPQDLINLAKNSISIDDPEKEFLLIMKIQRLIFLSKQLDIFSQKLVEITKSSQKEQLNIISSIKGIGEITAATFLAEIGNISNFSSYKSLVAFAGLDPVIYQSGAYSSSFRISKRGSPHIRRIIWLMTVYAVMYNKTFKLYFRKKRDEGWAYKKAMIATANKLIKIIYFLLKNGIQFDDSHALTSIPVNRIIHS